MGPALRSFNILLSWLGLERTPRLQGLCLPQCRGLTTPPYLPSSLHLLLSFGTFPNSNFWRQPKRSRMQKVTRALNTTMRGPQMPFTVQKAEQGARIPRPLIQLTSTVRDLEFAGLGTFLVSLGGGHSSSECLHDFVEQLWSKVMLKGLRGPKMSGGWGQPCQTEHEATRETCSERERCPLPTL